MALADFYELRVTLSLLSKQMYLVFHLRRLSGEFDAGDIIDAFEGRVVPVLSNAMSESVNIESVYCWNLDDAEDFDERSIDEAGLQTGQVLPPHDCATIRFPRLKRGIHHGYKRIPGISETYVENGLISGDQATAIAELAAALRTNWFKTEIGVDDVCEYVIIKRIKYEEEGKTKYRLPETDGELDYYRPLEYDFNLLVRTQVSRKL